MVNRVSREFIEQINLRFGEIHVLEFFELLNEKKFPNYRSKFPMNKVSSLIRTYKDIFDKEQLINELQLLYDDQNKHLNAKDLLNYMFENELENVYSQTVKLLQLHLSIPCTSVSSERSMSALKRIKTYLRNSMNDDRLSDLSKISIEREIAKDIVENDSNKEKLIDRFAEKKDRRINLVYKKIP